MLSQPSFARAIRAAEKDTDLSKTQLMMLKKVAEDLDSGVLSRAAKSPGSDTFKNMSFANVIGGIDNLLSHNTLSARTFPWTLGTTSIQDYDTLKTRFPTPAVTTTTAATFIPEIWSDEIVAAYKKNLVLEVIILLALCKQLGELIQPLIVLLVKLTLHQQGRERVHQTEQSPCPTLHGVRRVIGITQKRQDQQHQSKQL